MVNRENLLSALDSLIDKGDAIYEQFIRELIPWPNSFLVWHKASESTIEAIYGSESNALLSFRAIQFLPPANQAFANDEERRKAI